MRRWQGALIAVLSLTVIWSCSDDDSSREMSAGNQAPVIPVEEGFFGWDSNILYSPFARLDVVPDLGGKIMGYELRGTQLLWHDTTREGELYSNEGYGFGESFFNPGGAKVWPAPQGWSGSGEWPGPPDNVLDGSPYEVEYTDSTIVVIGPEDTADGRTGLQYRHTYSFEKSSSKVNLDLTMTNVSDRTVSWGLWHLATVPVNESVTVYVPVKDGDWHVIYGEKDNPQWQGVTDGIFQATYQQKVGKVGMKVTDGWAAWYDAEKELVYALIFPVSKGRTYPDNGSNFEIWANGAGTIKANGQDVAYEYSPETANMELEVMGPIERMSPGDTKALNVQWAACRASGVESVNEYGVVSRKPEYVDGHVKARYGTFYGGILQAVYLDKNRKQTGMRNIMDVAPLAEIYLDFVIKDIDSYADIVRYQVKVDGTGEIGVLGEIPLP